MIGESSPSFSSFPLPFPPSTSFFSLSLFLPLPSSPFFSPSLLSSKAFQKTPGAPQALSKRLELWQKHRFRIIKPRFLASLAEIRVHIWDPEWMSFSGSIASLSLSLSLSRQRERGLSHHRARSSRLRAIAQGLVFGWLGSTEGSPQSAHTGGSLHSTPATHSLFLA